MSNAPPVPNTYILKLSACEALRSALVAKLVPRQACQLSLCLVYLQDRLRDLEWLGEQDARVIPQSMVEQFLRMPCYCGRGFWKVRVIV